MFLLPAMYPSRLSSAPFDANVLTALESTYAVSGTVPPAIWVVSLSVARSAGTFWNSTVMFGCSLWKSSANFLNCGDCPTHDSKVIVTGDVGSFGVIGLIVAPDARGCALSIGSAPPPH